MQHSDGKRLAIWLIASIVAHVLLLAKLHASELRVASTQKEQLLWSEELSLPVPEPAAAAAAPTQPEPPVAALPKPPPRPRLVREASEGPSTAAEPGGVASQADGSVEAAGPVEAAGLGIDAAAMSGRPAPTRPAQPAQLSLWLAPIELQRMVIVRSPSALLAALPGYRDMLRGSDINPFNQLRALRVFLPGLAAEQLLVAGVHTGGEAEVMRAAERIAAARERVPSFRGSSQLRAASWLDGSGFDRGLALHRDAFLIGARSELPRVLGREAPHAQVEALSKTRRDVVVLATLHDATRYLPSLATCQLRSLRISISAALRLHLTADYETEEAAAQAATCLASTDDSASQLRWMRELLSRASAANGGSSAQLRTGVTSEEIAKLLDELCWSLRRVVHDGLRATITGSAVRDDDG